MTYLSDAKMQCESSSKCIGIYDELCDETGPFILCKERFFQSKVAAKTCVYQNKKLDGMKVYIRSFIGVKDKMLQIK